MQRQASEGRNQRSRGARTHFIIHRTEPEGRQFNQMAMLAGTKKPVGSMSLPRELPRATPCQVTVGRVGPIIYNMGLPYPVGLPTRPKAKP